MALFPCNIGSSGGMPLSTLVNGLCNIYSMDDIKYLTVNHYYVSTGQDISGSVTVRVLNNGFGYIADIPYANHSRIDVSALKTQYPSAAYIGIPTYILTTDWAVPTLPE